jgi:hypothetical protein
MAFDDSGFGLDISVPSIQSGLFQNISLGDRVAQALPSPSLPTLTTNELPEVPSGPSFWDTIVSGASKGLSYILEKGPEFLGNVYIASNQTSQRTLTLPTQNNTPASATQDNFWTRMLSGLVNLARQTPQGQEV